MYVIGRRRVLIKSTCLCLLIIITFTLGNMLILYAYSLYTNLIIVGCMLNHASVVITPDIMFVCVCVCVFPLRDCQ